MAKKGLLSKTKTPFNVVATQKLISGLQTAVLDDDLLVKGLNVLQLTFNSTFRDIKHSNPVIVSLYQASL